MTHYSKISYIGSSLVILFLLLGIGLYNQLKHVKLTDDALKPAPLPSIDPELRPFKPQIEAIKRLMKSGSTADNKAAEEKTAALMPQLPVKYQRYYVFGLEAGLEDVEFHGQIVDQYKQPVVGARVNYSIGGALMAAGSGSGIAVTDKQGRFAIKGRGGSLMLQKIDHPDIDFEYPFPTPDHQISGSRMVHMVFTGFQHTKGSNDPIWSDYTKDKPYVFKAWRVGKYEKVKKGRSSAFLLPDGRTYTVDFDKRKNRQSVEGEVDGYLRFSCVRGDMQHSRDWTDWTVNISAVDGGIQSTNDHYMNIAPVSGYQSEITISMTKSAPDYQHILQNQRYYFTAKNGQVYGSLLVNIQPHSSRMSHCIIRINQYKINSNGSRNLAVRWKD